MRTNDPTGRLQKKIKHQREKRTKADRLLSMKDEIPREVLATLPESVVAEIRTLTTRPGMFWPIQLLPVLLLLVGSGLLVFGYSRTIQPYVGARALDFAISQDAWLYDYADGPWLMPAVFATALLSWWAPIACRVVLPRSLRTRFTLALLVDQFSEEDGRQPIWLAQRSGRYLRSTAEVADLAASMALWQVARLIVPLLALGALLFALESRAIDFVNEKGLSTRSMLPWASRREFAWEDVDSVALGCIASDGDAWVIYEVSWANGPSIRISSFSVVGSREKIGVLGEIDAALTSYDVRFERAERVGRRALHPECLAAFRDTESAEPTTRVDRLLRVGELAGDASVAP